MKILFALLALSLPLSGASAQTAFEATTRGASCTQNSQGVRMCRFKIGADLEISITAIGSLDAGVSFLRSDHRGEYFARVSLQHQCIIIAAGEKAPASALTATGQYAFISPRTGVVYKKWQECDAAKS